MRNMRYFSNIFLACGYYTNSETVRALFSLLKEKTQRLTLSFGTLNLPLTNAEKTDKGDGYCEKVQSTAFCLRNKLKTTFKFFLFLLLPLNCSVDC